MGRNNEKMSKICEKCKENCSNIKAEQRITYEGIDEHHNPPTEISRFLKEEWVGDFYNLCRKCHKELHLEITKILKKYSNKPKYNSDYWLMLNSTTSKIKEAQEVIYSFTKEWIK